MNLKKQISEQLKAAMKSGDAFRRDTLRLLDSMIKNAEIEKKKREEGLSDEEILEVVSRAVKQRNDSITQFESAGRSEMAEKEKQELAILMEYLPKQLDADEVQAEVSRILDSLGEEEKSNFGKVMGLVMGKLKGKADGNIVKGAVEKILKTN